MKPETLMNEIKTVLSLEAQAIQDSISTLNSDQWSHALELCVKTLENGGKIVVTGIGKSGKVGQKIAATLSSTGSLAIFLHPTEGLHGDLGVVTSRDIVLALSYTGNTEELLKIAPSLKSRKVALISITGNGKSRLAELSDAILEAKVAQEACPHNLAPTTSTTLALAFGDALAIALMKLRKLDEKTFALNHPGGSLGKKLTFLVRDVMHPLEHLPILTKEATAEEVIGITTEKKLGAALVIDEGTLLGIITDGDIRRALQKKEAFFKLKAEDLMGKNPTVVFEDTLAIEALRTMEDRPSQISVLPVVNEKNQIKGLLRLHDLLQSF
ncbi:MAG: hypothetical protein CL678_18735 [Bdellovibrionaceae bacterium]|nr:hypothetical protein [Pseudobdellovibrionaceae bacterium]